MDGPQIMMIGTLTQDPRLRYTTKGVPYVTTDLAVHSFNHTTRETETTYYRTTFYNRMAQAIATHCQTGFEVLVQGSYRFKTYTNRDGTPGYSHEVVAKDLTRLTKPAKQTPSTATSPRA